LGEETIVEIEKEKGGNFRKTKKEIKIEIWMSS
jgi:hypothetical protein